MSLFVGPACDDCGAQKLRLSPLNAESVWCFGCGESRHATPDHRIAVKAAAEQTIENIRRIAGRLDWQIPKPSPEDKLLRCGWCKDPLSVACDCRAVHAAREQRR